MAQILDANGNALYPSVVSGAYLAAYNIRHTVADAAGSVVIALRNPLASTKTLYIKNIRGIFTFDGTAAAATSIATEWIRFSGGDPTTGTTMTRVKKRTAYAASQVLDANAQYKSGVITMTGVTFDPFGPFFYVRLPASVSNGVITYDMDLTPAGVNGETLELAAGEGIACRLTNAAIIGQGQSGHIEFDER